MNFETKKIKKEAPAPKPKPESLKKFKKSFQKLIEPKNLKILIPILVIIMLFFGITKAFTSINFKVFLQIAGEPLKTDQNGNSNFLVLSFGGDDHEGTELTDSIIVASINPSNNSIGIISIPRDTYIRDITVGNSRINQVFLNSQIHYGNKIKAVEHTKSVIEEFLGIPIHYWATVDFQGFVEFIDIIGGVEVLVKTSIYDPYYPLDGTYRYQTFSIGAGLQQMDGATALKYARSRQTTSDFDRSQRQQDLIAAIKEKALKTEIVFSREKIAEIMETLNDHIHTNITVREILTLGAKTENYTKENISQYLMHDDPTKCGGFLYPPSRDLYGGMFVLIPAGGMEFIHKYAEMVFYGGERNEQKSRIHILNGTKREGTAGEIRRILQRYCYRVPRFGNARNQEITKTTYYYLPKTDGSRPKSLDFLQTMIPGEESTEIPQEYIELDTQALPTSFWKSVATIQIPQIT
jgi:polyisoprenyl-teichoic acid--peptidoglycan teichoic acid transferase